MSAMPRPGKKSLAALVGAVAASLLLVFVPKYEGEVLTTYADPVGIATVCYGDTDPAMAVPGASYSREECLRSLERQLIAHAGPVLQCAPDVEASPEMTAAFVSLAYNIGTGAFCRSTVVRRFKAGDYSGACSAMEMWNRAGGKVLPGLVRRRADERALCERGIPAMREAVARDGDRPRSASEHSALRGEARASVAQDVRPSAIMRVERALCERGIPAMREAVARDGDKPRSASELSALRGEARASVAQDVRPSVIMRVERALCERGIPAMRTARPAREVTR